MVTEKTIDVDALAQEIRRVDGNNKLGAGALAEALLPFLSALSTPPEPVGVEVKGLASVGHVELLMTIKEFARWYHLNEMTLTAGKTPSDSEIDFEATAWNRITRALTPEAGKGETHTPSPLDQMATPEKALRMIAAQALTSEISDSTIVSNDLEGAHDAMILRAREALFAVPPLHQMTGWTKVTPDMPFEVLKSITIDNQVLAFERGRYFNAWLKFDEYEGGWCWVDEADSEPSPSHYRPLHEVALTTEGQP